MRVPVIGVAREIAMREPLVSHASLLPFAIQRFFQARRLHMAIASGTSREFLPFSVRQVVFAWNNGDVENLTLIPTRFSLLRTDDPICFPKSLEALGFPRLFGHDLLTSERAYFQAILADIGIKANATLLQLPSLQHVEHMKPDLLRDISPSHLWLWQARFDLSDCSSVPRLSVQFLFVLDLGSAPAWTDETHCLAKAIHSTVSKCLEIFSGAATEYDLESDLDTLFVQRRMPVAHFRRDQALKPSVDNLPKEIIDNFDEAAAVDRLLQMCSALRRPGVKTFDPLTIAVIRRSGDKIEPSYDGEMTIVEARGRFAFGTSHWKQVSSRFAQSSEYEQFCNALTRNAIALHGSLHNLKATHKEVWHREFREKTPLTVISDGLKLLGILFDDPNNVDDLTRMIRFPTADKFFCTVKKTLLTSFPVRSVVSNRIMGSCAPEAVRGLWHSSGVLSTLSNYPRDLYLIEMTLLPAEVGDELFYAPLKLPQSRRTESNTDDFFLSFAVAMAPPSVIDPEDFRDIARLHTEDLYLAFLEQAQRRGTTALKTVSKSLEDLLIGSEQSARMKLEEAARDFEKAKLDVLRLHDFNIAGHNLYCRIPIKHGWGVARLTIKEEVREVRNDRPLDMLEQVDKAAFDNVSTTRANQLGIYSKLVINVDHGGLVTELRGAAIRLENLEARLTRSHVALLSGSLDSTTVEVFQNDIRDVRRVIRQVCERWRILAKRQRSDGYDATGIKPLGESEVRDVLKDAWDLVRDDVGRGVRTQPRLEVSLRGRALVETRGGLIELIQNLLANLVKYEHVDDVKEWGVDVSWLHAADCDQWQSETVGRWREDIGAGGAGLIRAFPTSLSEKLLQRQLSKPEGMGYWVIRTLTHVYCDQSVRDSHDVASIVPIRVVNCDGAFVEILVPGR